MNRNGYILVEASVVYIVLSLALVALMPLFILTVRAAKNTERIVILQIESPEALENVEKIAALPGFDMLLFGPGDFSHRIGKPGDIGAPEVVAARKRIAAAAKKNGKFLMAAGVFAPLAEMVAEGHGLFSIGADVVAIANYTKDRLQTVRGQIAGLPPEIRPKSQSLYS